jgi:EAL domain-containing protein (putative c-di-GMP-specific phosphodiesterase class I)/GGDEF domain-containing protein
MIQTDFYLISVSNPPADDVELTMIMPIDTLIESLPDLVVLLRRDGIIVSHGGGHGPCGLKLNSESTGKRLDSVWPEAVAELVIRLSRRAIALRASTEARFQDGAEHYEARLIAQGPDRVLCIIRPLLATAPEDALDITGERPRPQLDRRGFLRRFKESMSLATLCEKPAAIAVIHLDGVTDVAQSIDAKIAEQLVSTAILRLPAQSADHDGEKFSWFLGQLSDSLLALVIETSDRDAIDAIVSTTCASLREPITVGDAAFHLTPHAGVAVLSQDATSPKTLLDHARAAAIEAQRRGSAKVCFFTDALKLRSLARLDIARELREAIANRDICLRYVGRHDLATGRLVGWVGYLRWIHPVRGEVRPVEFLRVAESTGLAAALSRTVLGCLQQDFTALASQWDADVRISFGALRHHILQDDFTADIRHFLAEGAVPAHRLELRIAEKTFVACDPAVLEDLQRLGIQLVVDEVGRGLGSLDSLARAPIWGLQLDRAWVTALHGDEVALKVCRAGISMATALGLTPIATGVDDQEQRDQLLALGCRHGSGDLYQDAVPNIMKPYRTAVSE